MKKFLFGFITSAGLLLACCAHATTINFDDLNANNKLSSISKYNPYETFTWSTSWFLGNTNVGGYSSAAHSGTNFLSNGFGVNNLTVSNSDGFDFLGAWFATPTTNGAKASWINITAFDSANQVIGTTGNVAINQNYLWVAAPFTNVTSLKITRDKGWFVMDDFSFKTPAKVPEPSPLLLLVLGLACFGLKHTIKCRKA